MSRADATSFIHGSSVALLTDLYQLTMAYGYWKNEVHERESVFHLFFRKNPFKGGYAIACGELNYQEVKLDIAEARMLPQFPLR